MLSRSEYTAVAGRYGKDAQSTFAGAVHEIGHGGAAPPQFAFIAANEKSPHASVSHLLDWKMLEHLNRHVDNYAYTHCAARPRRRLAVSARDFVPPLPIPSAWWQRRSAMLRGEVEL